MRDIKTKERNNSPRIRGATVRMPKELVKSAVLMQKEKPRQISREADPYGGQSSPTEYASAKLKAGEKRAIAVTSKASRDGIKAGKAVAGSFGNDKRQGAEKHRTEAQTAQQAKKQSPIERGKEIKVKPDIADARQIAAKKVYIKTKEEERRRKKAEFAREEMELTRLEQGTSQISPNQEDLFGNSVGVHKNALGEGIQNRRKGHISDKRKIPPKQPHPKIKTKPDNRRSVRTSGQWQVKDARALRVPAESGEKIKVRRSTERAGHRTSIVQARSRHFSRALQARKQAHQAEQAVVSYMQKTVQSAKRTTSTSRRIIMAAEKAFSAARAVGMMLGAVGGIGVLMLIVTVGVIGGVFSTSTTQNTQPLSPEVLAYTATIEKYAAQYGIPEYVQVIQAIMMQESAGRGTDPMQCSECPYNTEYPNTPGAITDPDYSIHVGIRYYADCIKEAGCTGPQDMDRLKLSLQGYNYGNGYISWALNNYGGYSEANALQFSQEQAIAHGWGIYGDPLYVQHVLQYYSGANFFAGLFGNGQIISVALSQLGNAGGQKFWSWYGFGSRVSWCACFASWCADQCGLIESGAVPKFSLCDDGIAWFKAQGRWQDGSYIPSAGTLVFFDWPNSSGARDGSSDHVGIVEKCENGMVYTVEGNSSDAVRQRNYPVGYDSIMGYGLVAY